MRLRFVENIIIFAAFFANIFFNIFLYYEGYSWTPFFYEDLIIFLPLLQRKGKNAVALFICALLLITKVIYFNFYLTLPLLLDFWYVKVTLLMVFMVVIYGLFAIKTLPSELVFSTLFLLFISSSYYILDKEVLQDKFAASYTPHFLGKIYHGNVIQKSPNKVYTSIKQDLDQKEGVILVIWEALGVPVNEALINQLDKFNLQRVLQLDWEGGSTVPAEIRYLCGTNIGFESRDCLPQLVKNSYAFHGNSLAYFNRNLSYKEYGFRNIIGKKIILRSRYHNCSYAYVAICDEDLFKVLFEDVDNKKCDGIFYALTIDSHYPYSKYKQHDVGLFSDLSKFISQAQNLKLKHKRCNIYIAGDHPPPLSSDFLKNKILFIKI